MSRFAHHASTHASRAEFELLQDRYIAVPALLWGLAMLVAIAVTPLQGASADATAQPLTIEDSTNTPYGA